MTWAPDLDITGIPFWDIEEEETVDHNAVPLRPELPMIAGRGPVEWSTCTELAPDPIVIHDGNWYYRSLGFSWPFLGITKKMLRIAYTENNGQKSVFKTYSFKRLLNNEFRYWYNRMEFGRQKMDDYFFEAQKANAIEEARIRTQETGIEFTADDILEEWGIPFRRKGPPNGEPDEPVGDEELPLADDDVDGDPASEDRDTVSDTWPWGYFAWRSSARDTQRLGLWQRLLLEAAREQGLRARLAVGYVGQSDQDWVVTRVRDITVVYLHEMTEPSKTLADRAVSDVMTMMNMMEN